MNARDAEFAPNVETGIEKDASGNNYARPNGTSGTPSWRPPWPLRQFEPGPPLPDGWQPESLKVRDDEA